MVRDLSHAQLMARIKKQGWTPTGFLGYVEMPLPGGGRASVSRLNAGPRRRDQLAYLMAEYRRLVKEAETALAAKENRP